MNKVDEKKKAWRRLLYDLFRLLPREERRKHDAILSERVEDYVRQAAPTLLMGFAPMADEPDLSAFYRRWLQQGGKFALPVWLGGNAMIIREITDLDKQLHPGRGGILEPLADLPEIAPEQVDLVISPGRAFSETCARMGRGSGCYDALFNTYGMAKFGVAYEFQVFPKIPTDAADARLDAVVTPTRMLKRGATRTK